MTFEPGDMLLHPTVRAFDRIVVSVRDDIAYILFFNIFDSPKQGHAFSFLKQSIYHGDLILVKAS